MSERWMSNSPDEMRVIQFDKETDDELDNTIKMNESHNRQKLPPLQNSCCNCKNTEAKLDSAIRKIEFLAQDVKFLLQIVQRNAFSEHVETPENLISPINQEGELKEGNIQYFYWAINDCHSFAFKGPPFKRHRQTGIGPDDGRCLLFSLARLGYRNLTVLARSGQHIMGQNNADQNCLLGSSPYHPQGNGLAERSVETAKNIIRKCSLDNTDVRLALLNYRNTPRNNKLGSPNERLFSRITRSLIPTSTEMLKPILIEDVDTELTTLGKNKRNMETDIRKSKKLPREVFFRLEQQQQRYPERKRTALLCNGYYGHIAKNCDRVPDNDNCDKREKTKSDHAFFTVLSVQGSPEANDWYLDSGCSVYLAKDEHCFVSELKPAKVGFSTADQQGSMNSNSVGHIQLPVKVDGAVMPVEATFLPLTLSLQSDSDYIPPETVDVENKNLRRGTRDKRPPIHLQDYDLNFVLTVLSDDPVTVNDALSRPGKEEWWKAMDREYKAQLDNG
ncbi:hypothetical protein JTB14_018723 [Gonioctena quinquepunctata]|nr:hypothetical protein JTB14_018723 [Gonioctena quinquepunctata]